jgi:DNA polymerase IV
MERRLIAAGVTDIAALWALPPKQARAIWGSVAGERFWYALHGYEVPDLVTHQSCIGHSRVLDPKWRLPEKARLVARELALKAARRLRRYGQTTGEISLSLRLGDGVRREAARDFPSTQDSFTLLGHLDTMWHGLQLFPRVPIKQAAIMLHALTPLSERTDDLFTRQDAAANRREKLWSAIDHLRSAHGLKICLASQGAVHLQDLGTKIAFTRIPELAEFME